MTGAFPRFRQKKKPPVPAHPPAEWLHSVPRKLTIPNRPPSERLKNRPRLLPKEPLLPTKPPSEWLKNIPVRPPYPTRQVKRILSKRQAGPADLRRAGEREREDGGEARVVKQKAATTRKETDKKEADKKK